MTQPIRLFEGMGVALITPFQADGSIDYASLQTLLEHIISGGADFVVVHGTTGESPCLSRDERNAVTSFVVQTVGGRIPIMIGLGGNNTMEVGERLAELDTTGLSGVLSVAPYYNKPSQEGIYEHFKHLAKCSKLPIVIYNVPGRVVVNVTPTVVAKLAEIPNIIGIKEASGYVAQVEAIHKLVDRPDFSILSGDDNLSIDFIRNGACGVISVIGNAYPKLFTKLIHLSMQGHHNDAGVIHDQLRDAYRLLFENGNPSGIKALLYLQNIIKHNVLRLPLTPVTEGVYKGLDETRRQIDLFIEQYEC